MIINGKPIECCVPEDLNYNRVIEAYYEMGALWRSNFRRACFQFNIKYKEDRSLLNSAFRCYGTKQQIMSLNKFITELYENINKRENR